MYLLRSNHPGCVSSSRIQITAAGLTVCDNRIAYAGSYMSRHFTTPVPVRDVESVAGPKSAPKFWKQALPSVPSTEPAAPLIRDRDLRAPVTAGYLEVRPQSSHRGRAGRLFGLRRLRLIRASR